MNDSGDTGYISDFSAATRQTETGPIDFSKAKRVNGTGSTCDIFIAVHQRRRVFVKRLKPELRDKSLYLEALEKEFEIGVTLNHPSLARYIEFQEDYLIQDYIDGSTLLELIQNKDSWLQKEKNILKMFKELIDVVGYLHHHNVIHSDIKADQIILVNGTRNLVLVDFDKCYTSWLPSTAGSSELYGVDRQKTGHPDIDFRGIGLLVDKLSKEVPDFPVKRLKKFRDECFKDNVDVDELEFLLKKADKNPNHRRNRRFKDYDGLIGGILFIGCILILAIIGLTLDSRDREERKENLNQIEPIKNKSEELMETIQPDIIENLPTVPKEEIKIKEIKEMPAKKELTDEEKGRILDEKLITHFKVLDNYLAELEKACNDTSLSSHELREMSELYVMSYDNVMAVAYNILYSTFPETEKWTALNTMVLSSVYSRYSSLDDSINKVLFKEIRNRAIREKEKSE